MTSSLAVAAVLLACSTEAQPARRPLRARPRAFVASPTVVEGPLAKQPVPGFEKTWREVRRAPQSAGRIEFEPPAPSPAGGQDYRVPVYFVTQGRQPVSLREAVFQLTVNGRRTSSRPTAPLAPIRKGERVLVHELRGRWPAAARSWSLRVQLTAAGGDTYKSQLAWQ